MSMTHLPVGPALPVGSESRATLPAQIRNDPSAHEEHSATSLSGELVDFYSLVLIAVPLAMFLKWLWP